MMGTLIPGRRTVEVPCTVRIGNTGDGVYADVELDGYEVGAGDKVTVHGVPPVILFGQQHAYQCRATVKVAGWPDRVWTRATAYLELTELYEIGFSAGGH